MNTRILLWYPGDSDGSQHVHRLTEVHGGDVVTLTLDLGQGRDLEEIRDRALAAGAVRAHVLDARDEFVHDFVLPSLRAGVSPAGPEPLAVALAQPLVARKLIEIAAIEGAASVAHGETGEDRMRLEASLKALDDKVPSIALRQAAGASELGQANLWGRVRVAKTSPAKSLDTPASVDVTFARGVPTAINGVSMARTELIESLSTIGGRHGVGRMMLVDAGAYGSTVADGQLRVYEAPAAVILDAAHRALEAAVVPSKLIRIQRDQAVTYAQLVYGGRWFTETRELFDAFSARMQEMVTGTIRIKLFGGELLSTSIVEGSGAVVSHS
jgi:argininosuccinate synthase